MTRRLSGVVRRSGVAVLWVLWAAFLVAVGMVGAVIMFLLWITLALCWLATGNPRKWYNQYTTWLNEPVIDFITKVNTTLKRWGTA